MCKMRVVVLNEMLGNRETGWSLFDGNGILELTSKQIKDLIAAGNKVCGLTIGEKEDLVMDEKGFFTTNMMEHRHCGNYKPVKDEGCMATVFYICIGSHEEKGEGLVYDCITTKFARESLCESDMKAYLKLGIVTGGAKLEGEKIVVASLEPEKKKEKTVEKPTENVVEIEKPVKPVEKPAEKTKDAVLASAKK